jgi:hypothetical protein
MKLQSLQIPQGWFIDYNQFYDIEPSKINIEDISTYFNEDILQFTHKKNNKVIDLGWYPERVWDEGAFTLVIYEGDFHGKLLYKLRTKDKTKVVNEINRLLLNYINPNG